MGRLHLFEFEDQPWLPRVFRDFITDQLRFAQTNPGAAAMQRTIGGLLKQALEQWQTCDIIDLCSGGGGPLPAALRRLRKESGYRARLTLTDLYPNVAAFKQLEASSDGELQCRYESTSVFDVPADLRGLRTLCTALHHFRPDDARRIFQDAVDKQVGIAVFEPLDGSVRLLLTVTAGAIVFSLFSTPFVGRITLPRLFFTYVLPICPLLMAWDGGVSVLRSYSVRDLEQLTAGLGEGRYEWKIARVRVPTWIGRMPLTYVVGLPVGGKG